MTEAEETLWDEIPETEKVFPYYNVGDVQRYWSDWCSK